MRTEWWSVGRSVGRRRRRVHGTLAARKRELPEMLLIEICVCGAQTNSSISLRIYVFMREYIVLRWPTLNFVYIYYYISYYAHASHNIRSVIATRLLLTAYRTVAIHQFNLLIIYLLLLSIRNRRSRSRAPAHHHYYHFAWCVQPGSNVRACGQDDCCGINSVSIYLRYLYCVHFHYLLSANYCLCLAIFFFS